MGVLIPSAPLSAQSENGQLQLYVEARPDPVSVGDRLTYRLQVSNTGSAALDDVWLYNTVPPYVNNFDEGGAIRMLGGNCEGRVCEAGETIEWQIGTLPAGGSATRMFSVRVNSGAGALITSSATAEAGDGSTAAAVSEVRVSPAPSLTK